MKNIQRCNTRGNPIIQALSQLAAVCLPLILLSLLIVTSYLPLNASRTGGGGQRTSPWTLVWHDEFDGPSLDTSKWNVYDEPGNASSQALHYYAPDDVTLHAGALRLTSRVRPYKGWAYTSGAVNTQLKFGQTYGKWEVRARLPGTQGLWPAHWLLPEDGTWPPEIDIMELLGHDPNSVYMTNHWKVDQWQSDDLHRLRNKRYTSPANLTAGFHTYTIEWEPGKLRWLIDGVERFASTSSVPDKAFYLVLNTAIGGDWPGKPDASTVFPQHHDIDYVRVYRRAEQSPPPAAPAPPALRSKTFLPREWRLRVVGAAQAQGAADKDIYTVAITAVDDTDWHIEAVPAGDLPLVNGQIYTLRFLAKADQQRRLRVSSYAHGSDWHTVGLDQTYALTTEWKVFHTTFVAKDVLPNDNRLPQFLFGQSTGTVSLAEVTLRAGS